MPESQDSSRRERQARQQAAALSWQQQQQQQQQTTPGRPGAMSMNRDNFRANQPPSKVLHIRNLPPDATEQELLELCRPFGRVTKVKLNAGESRNQCFVEFESVNCAIQMIYSFVGSADPPKVRNKTVYLQYSTRHEIGGAPHGGGGGGGAPYGGMGGGGGIGRSMLLGGPVILIIMDNLQLSLGPSLDTLHLLCSAFGEVAKMTLFEKSTGLQALVQFRDPAAAREAQQTLDGSAIPEHLVPQHPGRVVMKVGFSQHADLTIHAQSDRSRDFTVPPGYLPEASHHHQHHHHAPPGHSGHGSGGAAAGAGAAGSAAAGAAAAPAGAAAGAAAAAAGGGSRVLRCVLQEVAYAPTIDALHTVFGTYGSVQRIAISDEGGQWQVLVQYPDGATSALAMQYLQGHAMYPGGKNKLQLSHADQQQVDVPGNSERAWDFQQGPGGPTAAAAAAVAGSVVNSGAAADGISSAAGQAASGGGGGDDAAAASGSSSQVQQQGEEQQPQQPQAQQPPLSSPLLGVDYEHAHNEVARMAAEFLGDAPPPLPFGAGPPPHAMAAAAAAAAAQQYWGGPPRPMVSAAGSPGGGGYGGAWAGYGPGAAAAGYPPPAAGGYGGVGYPPYAY